MVISQKKEIIHQEQNLAFSRWQEVLRFFPVELREILTGIPESIYRQIIELRLRVNHPFELNCGEQQFWLKNKGGITDSPSQALIITSDMMKKAINAMTTGSLYALDEEIAQGYLALPGGHRIGFCGRVILNAGQIKLMRNISSLNFRIAKEVRGIARPVLPFLWKEGRVLKTLILSPPACGKTTLLREIVRELSSGIEQLAIPPLHIGLVDERSEIAGSYQGIAQLDVGPHTDILDSCPKNTGVYLLLRSMNPQLIATDEIGRHEDIAMIEDIINAGISFIVTAHARNLVEAMCRPGLKKLLELGAVERLIVLSNRLGIGTVESIRAGTGGAELWHVCQVDS